MKRKATLTERIGLFVVWPLLAPVILVFLAFTLVMVWPAILFVDLEITER